MRIELKLSQEELNTVKRYFAVFGVNQTKMQDKLSVPVKKTTDDFELQYAPATYIESDGSYPADGCNSVKIYISEEMLTAFLDIGKSVVPFAKSIAGMLMSLKDLYVEKCVEFELKYLKPIDEAKPREEVKGSVGA